MIATDAAVEFFLEDRSTANRDRVVAQYSYLLARGARKFYRTGLDRNDLRQIAAVGLLKACDRYDGRNNTPFEAYAWLFIVGELMHYVRDYERIVRPPRKLRRLERAVQTASEQLVWELGREPTKHEIANRVGVAVNELEEVHAYREQAVSQSLDLLKPAQLRPYSYTFGEPENRVLIECALNVLTDLEKTIVVSIYERGYTQAELAERLGFSRRHVSRLHRSALQKMHDVCVAASA